MTNFYTTAGLTPPKVKVESPVDKIKLVIERYKYSVYPYGELSRNPTNTRFWFKPWGMVEVEINEESYLRWFEILWPEGLPHFETVKGSYGDSDLVKERFLDEGKSTD